jgi:hypothetical protein
MKNVLLAGTLLAALGASPAWATLQLSIDVNGTVFSCADGAACDQSTTNSNLLVIDQTVDGVLVQVTLAQSTSGTVNILQLSSSNIENNSNGARTITLVAGDTNFTAPVERVNDSGSLTFNQAVGSGQSSLLFFADAANTQGANPLNTPGTLLEQVFGTPATNPDSFAGSNFAAFLANSPFSMTEEAVLSLNANGSITGFNQSMTSSAIPEPKTWAMFGIGLIALAAMKFRRRHNRLGDFA